VLDVWVEKESFPPNRFILTTCVNGGGTYSSISGSGGSMISGILPSSPPAGVTNRSSNSYSLQASTGTTISVSAEKGGTDFTGPATWAEAGCSILTYWLVKAERAWISGRWLEEESGLPDPEPELDPPDEDPGLYP